MFIRYDNDLASQTGRNVAMGLFVVGLLLIGFAMLVWVLKEFFAFVAAGVFVLAGLWCCVNAGKIFFATRSNSRGDGRRNVRVHIHESD